MKTIYIDSDFKCHLTDDGTMTAIETDFFDGKSDIYIEGYRFVPTGESWTRHDGTVFTGEMVAPWKTHAAISAAQEQYEKDLLERADLEAAYNYLLTGGIA
jgi:hypothetical protein